MPRPLRLRRIWFAPEVTYFKPSGVPLRGLQPVNLTMDELEAIRLKDLEDLSQTEAAKKMGISQPTFARLLDGARKKVARALVEGRPIRIGGGVYEMVGPGRFGRGRGGPIGYCVCPKCGYREPKRPGVPCATLVCPKCKIRLVRG